MRSKKLAGSLVIAVSSLGCGAANDAVIPASPHHNEARPAPVSQGAHLIAVAPPSSEGEPREVRVLLDRPDLKLALITLRDGTELPAHSAPVPVTIQALAGAGTAVSGSHQMRYERGAIWVLDAEQPHAIKPDTGVTMVLLVHYLKGASGSP